MIFEALTFIAILFLITLLWWYQKYRYFYSGLKSVPGPLILPLIGSGWQITSAKQAFPTLQRNLRDFGTVIKEASGPLFALFVIDPDMVQFIMTNVSTINKSRAYNPLFKWLGTGLLTSSNPKWKIRRKLLTPAYHFKILEQFIDVFDKNGTKLVQKLQNRNNIEIDIHPLVSLCALDIISETAMGTCINSQDDEESDFVKATKQMTKIILKRAVNPIKMWDVTFRFTGDYRVEKKALKVIHDYTQNIIKTRRENLTNDFKNPIIDEEQIIGSKNKIPFLDLLLLSSINGQPLTDQDIEEEVNTFMFEGHDTVSAGISFCLYLISRNPEVQTKIINEQREIFHLQPSRACTYQDLQDMKYLEMVIKEGLRLYPPVPVFGRIIEEDVTYRDLTLKKGLEVMIYAYSLHRNEQYYKNPEVFDPERFTAENQAQRHPFSYIPFSGGFRNCIGQKFAMLELKSVIAKIVRNFVLEPVPNYEVDVSPEIITNSTNGIKIILRNREWN